MAWYWQEKDNIDQPLHVLMGGWPPLVFGFISQSLDVAMLVTLINLAYLARREHKQHPGRIFNLDMCFCLLGCVIGNVIVSMIVT